MASAGVQVRDTAALKRLIISHGYTQRDFAKQMKVTHTHLNRILHEKSRCGVALAFKMSMSLGVEFKELFRLEER